MLSAKPARRTQIVRAYLRILRIVYELPVIKSGLWLRSEGRAERELQVFGAVTLPIVEGESVGNHDWTDRSLPGHGKAERSSELCPDEPCRRADPDRGRPKRGKHELVALSDLAVGSKGEVARIQASERMRDKLMRRGLLPGVVVEMTHGGGRRRRSSIRVEGQDLSLGPSEARAVFVDTRGVEEASDAAS